MLPGEILDFHNLHQLFSAKIFLRSVRLNVTVIDECENFICCIKLHYLHIFRFFHGVVLCYIMLCSIVLHSIIDWNVLLRQIELP